MRDLADIETINGPDHAKLQFERSALVANASLWPVHTPEEIQRKHGDRVSARQRINGTPFKDQIQA